MPRKKGLFIISLSLFGLFLIFSYFVTQKNFTELDYDITVSLQNSIHRTFDLPFSFLSIIGSAEITYLIWAFLTLFFVYKRMWNTVTALFLLHFASVIEVAGKLFVFHPGPPLEFYRGAIRYYLPSQQLNLGYSYPSGHVTRTTFLIAFMLIYTAYRAKPKTARTIQLLLLLLLFAMVVSRVYLGEHWISDVIGGLLVGGSLGLLASLSLSKKP